MERRYRSSVFPLWGVSMDKNTLKVNDIVLFTKCVCGDGGLSDGNTYVVLGVKYPLFMFIDDNGKKRIRNITSRCFKKIKG